MQIKPTSTYHLKRGTCQKKRDRLFAQLPITSACLICNYIFTQQRGVAAINSAHLFMKSSRLKRTVPPGRCLQCCQQHSAHIVSIYPDVTAVALQLPSTVTHTHTLLPLIVIYHCVHCKGLLGIVLTVYICKGISSFFCL